MNRKRTTRIWNLHRWLSMLVLLSLFFLPACVGTDFVDELLGPDLSKVVIDEPSVELLLGEQYSLMADYYDQSGQQAEHTINWMSRDESVATVDAQGVVTAEGVGQTEVIASVPEGPRDSLLITVVGDPNAVASIEISGTVSTLSPGGSVQLSAAIHSVSGKNLVNIPLSWSSSAPEVATIDDEGLVKAVGAGKTEIRASAEGVMSPPFEINVRSAGNLTGEFSGAGGHAVSGSVTIASGDAGYELHLESDFQTQSGPGLHVYLSNSKSSNSGGADLGELQAGSGEQIYALPDGVLPSDYGFVLIYCQPFGVVFGYAELK